MTFQSELVSRDRADYGFARVRDVAFDAIHQLWQRRRRDGMKQKDIAQAIGRDPGWVSRKLSAPGNWTLRSLGELAEALNGEVEIVIHGTEDPPALRHNYHAYVGYGTPKSRAEAGSDGGAQVMGKGASFGWSPPGD